MSTTTGNIKISQLTDLDAIDNGNKVIIPVSKDNSTGNASTPEWESYSVSASVLSRFLENSLGINDVDSTKGIRSRVTDLESSNAKLNKILGNFNSESKKIYFGGDILNSYVSNTGIKVTDTTGNGLYISNSVNLKQGKLYLLKNTSDFDIYPSDISIISKVSTKGNQTVYEPLSTYYHYKGFPNDYLVIFATEDMNVVFSVNTLYSDIIFYSVDYAIFFEIADKLLTLNGEMMKVLVEAIVKNNKDIESLQEKVKDINKGYFESIDCDKCPSINGEPMVVIADTDPNIYKTVTGQIWVNQAKGTAFICVNEGNENTGFANCWKSIHFNI